MTLDVTGEIGPVLRVIASHDPAALTSRPAGLDELFLGFYRRSPRGGGVACRLTSPGSS